jgi:hypothetical protein
MTDAFYRLGSDMSAKIKTVAKQYGLDAGDVAEAIAEGGKKLERLPSEVFDKFFRRSGSKPSAIVTVNKHQKRNDPMKLSPTQEAARILAEYKAEKRAKELASPIEAIHKANHDPVLASDHYTQLMKRVAQASSNEIAKVKGTRPKVVHAQPDSDKAPDDDGEPLDKKIARIMREKGWGVDKFDLAASQAINDGPRRFATTSETDLNGGSPRQVTGANLNPRPLSP